MTTDIARRWNALVDNEWTIARIGRVCVIRDKYGCIIATALSLDIAIDDAIRNTEGK